MYQDLLAESRFSLFDGEVILLYCIIICAKSFRGTVVEGTSVDMENKPTGIVYFMYSASRCVI